MRAVGRAPSLDIRGLIGLLGVLTAAVVAEFNDQVTGVALADIQGGLRISHDPGTWFGSLYISAEIVGMAISPWMLVTFTLRRWTLFVIGLSCLSTVLIPFSPQVGAVYLFRVLQGLAGGLTIPLLMATALRVLPPPIRLYGLAVYALTATFTPSLANSLATLWTDVVHDWRFVFFEAMPLCAIAAVLVWYGVPQDRSAYDRFRLFDWRGVLSLVIGMGAFSTMLQQGDRLDWFNSKFICVLALISAVTIPLMLINEWFHPLPLMKLQLFGRRNFAYAAIALFTFLLIGASASTIPLQYLTEVQHYRPLQSNWITLEIAAAQLVLLPAAAWLLDHRSVDARVVSFVGLALILAACIGNSFVTVSWDRGQFFLWQGLQALGQPLVIMPLLMMATNTVRGPEEAPFASALVNMPRAVSEATSVWLLGLIQRWRGGLHSNRLVDQIGQQRYGIIQGYGVLPQHRPPLLPSGQPSAPGSLATFNEAVQQQAMILTASDAFLVMGALTVALMIVLLVLSERTLPPRIQLSQQ